MKLKHTLLPLAIAAAVAAPAAHAEVAIDVIGDSEVSFEGLVQADMAWYSKDLTNLDGDAIDGSKSDYGMRRAELVLKGKGPGNNEWVLGFDASSKKWLDVNWKHKIGANANHFVQFGQYKQPNSLEELSSTKNNDFIAKAMITNTFGVGRRLGVAYGIGDSNWGVTGSLFGRELTRNAKAGNGYGLRGYFAPMNAKGSILHFGLSYVRYAAVKTAVGNEIDDVIGFSTKPGMDLTGASLIKTGDMLYSDRVGTLGFESFWVNGPIKLQGEYMRTGVSRYNGASDWNGKGGYISAVWNITGETWGYKNGVPTTPGADEPSTGMWQLGLRYDTLRFDNFAAQTVTVGGLPVKLKEIPGGTMSTWTVGLNWYWRQNFKFALDYVHANSSVYSTVLNKDVEDNPSAITGRIQFYW